MNILVIAAHPDDETLGMGATIRKLSMKNIVNLCVITEGATAQYEDKKMIEVRRNACLKSGKLLGISNFDFLDFPDMRLDSIPQLEINKKLEKIIRKYNPHTIYTTPPNDLNKDHQKTFESTLVATRPSSSNVKTILCYEVPSPVRYPFVPTIYETISKEILSIKIKACKIYKTEIEEYPHPRSLKSITNLSIRRGVEAGIKYAEAFQLVRSISN